MKFSCISIILVIAAPFAFGSPQEPERLTMDGKILPVYGFDLNVELEASIEEIVSKRGYHISSSGNHDGFYADLQIRDKKLILTGLWIKAREADFANSRQPVPISAKEAPEGVHAEWFTGTLMIHEQTDENVTKPLRTYTVLHFERGIFTKQEERAIPEDKDKDTKP